MNIYINNLNEFNKFGKTLASLLKPGDTLCLNGNLGAGKTTLTQAIGKARGIKDYITSPTFNLINQYGDGPDIYHIDSYRLENVDEIDDLGFDDYFYSNAICIVEWADRIELFLPKDRLEIDIFPDGEKRRLNIKAKGKRANQILEELKNLW
ncbi:MAG: tRNA (adenosine(37)-N6)-threonylcarbamoyltransferase complex ATPase subunit type 1 TsaE [Tissierellia bacterium]|nr:tRNA (adenosine(37)-N6)-threonylcarbamoyltransferase complex ATPase subunit type 1 TsaE [Tissierellia bacterium]